jgi:biotin carboxylase
MRAMGSKVEARALARSHGVPVTPGSDALEEPEAAARAAQEIGFPVIVKPNNGSQGRDVAKVYNRRELDAALRRLARFEEREGGDK